MKTLRPYQDQLVRDITRPVRDLLVEQPTGSGKTLVAVTATYHLLQAGYRVLIAAPQEHIEEGFTRRDYTRVCLREGPVPVPAEMIVAARSMDCCTDAIRDYLTGPVPPHALACTHAALTRVRPPTDIPAELRRSVLLVDEAHHANAVGLAQFVTAWRAAGGLVLYFTATAYRADEEPVRLPGMAILRRSLALHMEEGYAPARLESGVIGVRVRQGHVTPQQFRGEEMPATGVQRRLAQEILNRWREDGRPKSIVRIPPLRGGSGALVVALEQGFTALGARVLNVAGADRLSRQRFLRELAAERAVTHYADSRYDVLIGVQRVSEGLDWPLCSTLYCVGLPAAINTVVQLWGRTTRQKLADYPAEFAQRARLWCFAPCDEQQTLEQLPVYHSRRALVICSYLANAETCTEWAAVKNVARGAFARLGRDSAVAAVAEAYPYLDPVLRAQAELALAEAADELVRLGRVATDGHILEWVFEHRPEIGRAVVRQVLLEQIMAATGQSAEAVRRELHAELHRHVAAGMPLRRAIEEAFQGVWRDFDTRAVVESVSLAALRRHVLALGCQDIASYARRLAEVRPLTPEWVCRAAGEHYRATGAYPTPRSNGLREWPEESWAKIDHAIRHRERHWPLATFDGLTSFIQGYLVRGTMGPLLRQFHDDLAFNGIEAALLAHLLDCEFCEGDRVCRYEEVLAPGRRGTDPAGEILQGWLSHLVRHDPQPPLLSATALDLVEKLGQWAHQHREGVALGGVAARVKREWTAINRGRRVDFRVPPDGDGYVLRRGRQELRLPPRRVFGGAIVRCPSSAMWGDTTCVPLLLADGGRPNFRGLWPPLAFPVSVTLAGAPECTTRIPAAWIERQQVDGTARRDPLPTDWRRVTERLPRLTFSRSARRGLTMTIAGEETTT